LARNLDFSAVSARDAAAWRCSVAILSLEGGADGLDQLREAAEGVGQTSADLLFGFLFDEGAPDHGQDTFGIEQVDGHRKAVQHLLQPSGRAPQLQLGHALLGHV